MVEIIGVRFKEVGKIYYFDPTNIKFKIGDMAIVETSRGVEIGEIALDNRPVPEEELVSPLRPVIRMATKEDMQKLSEIEEKEKRAFDLCQEKIKEHKLDMTLIDVEYTFDLSKVLFYFTADGRVDFRELVKSLASIFKTRIELRQIGVRDEAKLLGGIGICGRQLCCKTFLNDFHPVSIKMAKEQNLSLNPTKISGCCGRLMCCLKYENDTYEEMLKYVTKVDAIVSTPDGKGVVVDNNVLSGIIKVKLDDSDKSPGFKFSEQEMRGIPLRIEIGPKDIENNQAILARRDNGEKITVSLDNIKEEVVKLLDTIQKDMFERAKNHREERTFKATDMDSFAKQLEEKPGFVKAMWCGDVECEEKIKELTGATSRCMPFEQEQISEKCVCCGKPAKKMVYWGKAY